MSLIYQTIKQTKHIEKLTFKRLFKMKKKIKNIL